MPRPPAAGVVHRGRGPLDHRGLRWLRVDAAGLVIGTLLAMVAATPSLVPRTWLVQGLAGGLSGAAGYGVGVTLWWALTRTRRGCRLVDAVRALVPPGVRRVAWPVLLVAVAVALLVALGIGAAWQRELAALVGTEPPATPGYLRAAPVSVVVAAVPIGLVRLARHTDHVVARGLHRFAHLPRRAARTAAVVLLVVIAVVLANSVARQAALAAADRAFGGVDAGTYPGDVPPVSPARSGSPPSLVGWSTLGKEGRAFVSGGPGPAALAAAAPPTGRAPVDPVRTYVGLASAPDAASRAQLAVAELDRAGAFSRSVLAVVTTTGTGWVDDPVADDLELLHGGDTAIVATQYSFLPSWLSFLLDGERATEEGRQLFDAVRARVDAIPPGQPRPRLVAFGESLGSQGSEAAFSSLADVRGHADGVLWVGPPHSNRLSRQFVERRDPGSTEVAPVYADGLVVRFSGGPRTAGVATDPPTPWIEPHVLFLAHPSDPVVRWTPSLLWERPDWLTEPRGYDVLGAMSWYPVVTFWQASVDLTGAVSVPDGHGHVYVGEMLDAWVAVAPPPGWTPADTDRVRAVAVS